jgi:hypothetical protein
MHTPSSVIASIFGLSAFAVAVLSGLLAGADATHTLLRAFPIMIGFYVVGAVVGSKIEAFAVAACDRAAAAAKSGGNPVENSGKQSDLAG